MINTTEEINHLEKANRSKTMKFLLGHKDRGFHFSGIQQAAKDTAAGESRDPHYSNQHKNK